MDKELLESLVCPDDKSRLKLIDPEYGGTEIKSAILECTSCHRRYLVDEFVPRFVETDNHSEKSVSVEAVPHKRTKSQDERDVEGTEPEALKSFLRTFYEKNVDYHQLIDKSERDSGYTYDHILVGLLDKLRGDRKTVRVLDVASGTGHYIKKALELGVRSYGMDISFHACKMAKDKEKGLFICQADAECLPFTDKVFDIILCLQLLEHTPYPERVISEIGRTLKPGGYLFLASPNVLGSNLLTRSSRALRHLFSGAVKDLKPLPDNILERWRDASDAREVSDMDACNRTNIFQALNLLKKEFMEIEYIDTLRHPKKYKPLKWTLAKISQKIPLVKYTGIVYKIIARKV